jgi:hypothetical protein
VISALVFFAIQLNAAEPTAKPQEWTDLMTVTATVESFTSDCVNVKSADGKKYSMKRANFKDMKLVSGTTKVEIHPETIEKDLCKK